MQLNYSSQNIVALRAQGFKKKLQGGVAVASSLSAPS